MTLVPRVPRSVRNNNPGNLERNGITWAGFMPLDHMTADQRAEQRFCVFSSPKYGFRALAIVLRTYRYTHACYNIDQIIKRFAPAVENATDAYIAAVALAMNVDPDEPLDLSKPDQLIELCRAISKHEAGGWFFNEDDLLGGVDMALYPTTRVVA